MLKEEFERLAGYKVTDDDYYKIIEPMYIATDLNKIEFIRCLNRSKFEHKTREQLVEEKERLINEIKNVAFFIYDVKEDDCCAYNNGVEVLDDKLDETQKRFDENAHIVWSNETEEYYGSGQEYPVFLILNEIKIRLLEW